jgi:alcohol dehydrogenase class IV
MNFEFATTARIVFGPGRLQEAGSLARQFGKRALVVTGRNAQRAKPLAEALAAAGMERFHFPISGEPTVKMVQDGAALARAERCDLVIAFGGGSALDPGKAIAVLVNNEGNLFDYLEVVGKGQELKRPGIPCVAIPTTAGTGAEVTRNAVLASPEHRVKVSLRSPHLLPRIALVDPVLTHGMPPNVTAFSGMDALTQLIEPFISPRANPLTDAISREGMIRVARSLRQAYGSGSDAEARENMSVASLFGGLALGNASLGAVHGFAAPIGGMFDAPHGAVCAALLPYAMEVNVQAMKTRSPEHPSLQRFRKIAQTLLANLDAETADGIQWVKALTKDLNIPGLKTYGVTPRDIPSLVEKAAASNSMKGNPVELTRGEMAEILAKAL